MSITVNQRPSLLFKVLLLLANYMLLITCLWNGIWFEDNVVVCYT